MARQKSNYCPISVGKARSLLSELQIQAADEIDVELIAGYLGLEVRQRELTNCEGRLLRGDDNGIIAVSEAAYRSNKWRFVIAHEIGHFVRHQNLNQLNFCSDADLRAAYGGREAEANDFAAELLMPSFLVERECDVNRPSLVDVEGLANAFKTSLTSAAIRFVTFAPEPCAVVHSTDGSVDWVARSQSFGLYIPKRVLGRGTYAGDLHAGEKVSSDGLSLVDGDEWSDSTRADEHELHEHSRRVASNAVLSFLWHPML